MLALFALELAMVFLTDKLVITGHEGDLLHMLDASLRMVEGERPHVDFMTPIGSLGFAPVAWFLGAGFAPGKATLLADITMLALLLPALWWVGVTRLSKGQAYYLATILIFTMAAVVYGGTEGFLSLSMYYNRWGWSISFLVMATVLFSPVRQLGERWIAPLVIGLGMAALLMLKITFFVPLLPVVILVLLLEKKPGLLLGSILVALVVGGLLLMWMGVDFFIAYINNLLAIMKESSGRQSAGAGFVNLLAGPNTLASSLVIFGGIFIYRKAGYMHQGLVLFILAPAFTYITYQNWGNDPKWLHLVVLYLWANLPKEGEKTLLDLPARQSILALIFVGLTVTLPSVFNLATSPLRVVFSDNSQYRHLDLSRRVSDIWLPKAHMDTIALKVSRQGQPRIDPDTELEINGFTFPDCVAGVTLVPVYKALAQEVEALDMVRGQPVLTADVLNPLWLLGDIARVPGAAPWYYGDMAGVANAAYLLVPMCPLKPSLRRAMLEQVQQAGYGLDEVYRSDILVLYAMVKPAE